MIQTLTYKWLSQALLSNPESFKDRFLQDFNETKYEDFNKLMIESLSVSQLIILMNHVDQKLGLLMFPFIFFITQNDGQVTTELWDSILSNDLGLDDRSAQCTSVVDGTLTINDCKQDILNYLLTTYWTNDSFIKLAEMINCCISAGAPVDRTKLQLFTFMETKRIYPLDLPKTVLLDYIGTTYSFQSYILNALVPQLYAYIRDSLTFTESSYDKHIPIVRELVKSKLVTNIYSEVELGKYTFIEYVFSQLQSIYSAYTLQLIDDYEWSFIPYGRQALMTVFFDFFKQVVEIDASDYDDLKQKLQDLITSYDFTTKLNDEFSTLWSSYNYKRKAFDKSRIQDYYNEVLDKSDDTSHIHFALFPLFQLICEMQDTASEDYLFATYNALNDIQELSNFHEVDIDNYVTKTLQQTYDSLPEIDTLVAKIQDSLQYVLNDVLDNQVEKYQIQDPFYQFYVSYQRLVMTVLTSSFDILLQPLYAELREKYNLSSLDDFKLAISSSIYSILMSQSGVILQKIAEIAQTTRQTISNTDLTKALDDLQNGTSKTLTKLLQSVVQSILSQSGSVVDFTSFKEEIKLKIINTLYEYAGQSNLMFDILSGNLDYLQKFDTYYGYFENACKNKLKFEINKYSTQLEHTFIGNCYTMIVDMDKLSYRVEPLVSNAFQIAVRLQRLLSTSFLYLDAIRYNSPKVMELPIYLKSCYLYFNKILTYMSNSDFYVGLVQSTIEV